MTNQNQFPEFGPIADLIGIWEGTTGHDVSPDDDRHKIEINKFREVIKINPSGEVRNHEQAVFALNYKLVATRLTEEKAFHEEFGYLLWEPVTSTLTRILIIPRGLSILAYGELDKDHKSATVASVSGSLTNGILGSPFLHDEFQMLKFECKYEWNATTLSYSQITVLQIKGMPKTFDHTQKNVLTKIHPSNQKPHHLI